MENDMCSKTRLPASRSSSIEPEGRFLFFSVTRVSQTRFGQVGDQVDQAEDQVGQGQGQELDNTIESCNLKL